MVWREHVTMPPLLQSLWLLMVLWWVSLCTWSPSGEAPSSTCWRPSWCSNWQQPGQCVGSTAGVGLKRNCWTGLAGSLSANLYSFTLFSKLIKQLLLVCPGHSMSPYLLIILTEQEVQHMVWSGLGKALVGFINIQNWQFGHSQEEVKTVGQAECTN